MSDQIHHAWNFALNGLARCGVNVEALLKELGLNFEHVKNQTTPYPTHKWCKLLDEAVRQTGDPNLGLKANLDSDFADYGPLGFAILNAKNLDQALSVMFSYIKIVQSGIEISSRVSKGKCTLALKITDWRTPIHRTTIDWFISFGVSFIRTWCGPDWSPQEIHLMYSEPDDTETYQRVIGSPIFFSRHSNCLIFSANILKKVKANADPRLFEILRNDLDRLFNHMTSETDSRLELVAEVQTEIAQQICRGVPSIEQVSEQLNVSTRTLQRHLAEKGYTFKDIVDSTRKEMAINYLESSPYSLIDIAFLLGYSEMGTFSRAFRRWTNMTPTAYRKQMNDV